MKNPKNGFNNSVYSEAISNRARFILSKMQLLEEHKMSSSDLYDYLQILLSVNNGAFCVYMAVTGCYPSKSDYSLFKHDIEIFNLNEAVDILVTKRSQKSLSRKFLSKGEFISVEASYLYDVTQTSFSPFITGIQRVVRRTGDEFHKYEVQQICFLGESGVLAKTNLESNHKALGDLEINRTWISQFIKNLHNCIPNLEKTKFGNLLKILVLPFMRYFKSILSIIELKLVISRMKTPENLYILDKKMILPEIPSLSNMQIYECLLENQFVPLQVVLYDFIPFFHSWTNPTNISTASQYLRILVLADKIVSISKLVHEQAQLVVKAISLERSDWRTKDRLFTFSNIPSGIVTNEKLEFTKIPNLVIMVGSIEPRKNYSQFFDALEILMKLDKPVKARIFGSAGWKNREIFQRVRELKAAGVDIEILSLPDIDLQKWIGEAEILLQLSEAEGSGMPVAEALALGTRVIVSDIRPLNEWESELITVVPLGQPRVLAEEIIRVLDEKTIIVKPQKLGVTWGDWAKELCSF
jgi:glycosyltransferase involved in cell wall biosynthesis